MKQIFNVEDLVEELLKCDQKAQVVIETYVGDYTESREIEVETHTPGWVMLTPGRVR